MVIFLTNFESYLNPSFEIWTSEILSAKNSWRNTKETSIWISKILHICRTRIFLNLMFGCCFTTNCVFECLGLRNWNSDIVELQDLYEYNFWCQIFLLLFELESLKTDSFDGQWSLFKIFEALPIGRLSWMKNLRPRFIKDVTFRRHVVRQVTWVRSRLHL